MAGRSHAGSAADTGGTGVRPRVRGGGGTGSVVRLTEALKAKFAEGKAGKSAVLLNADDFKAAKKTGGEAPKEAVLLLQARGDFHAEDFKRKAEDLVQLSRDEELYKAASDRGTKYHKKTDKYGHRPGKRSTTNIFRDRVIARLTKTGKKTARGLAGPRPIRHEGNKSLLDKLYAGKGEINEAGEGVDPDHIHELQLRGKDHYRNLRLMDAWTNRMLGSDIDTALRDVPVGTRVIVKLVNNGHY